jgi:hypothetical protein
VGKPLKIGEGSRMTRSGTAEVADLLEGLPSRVEVAK